MGNICGTPDADSSHEKDVKTDQPPSKTPEVKASKPSGGASTSASKALGPIDQAIEAAKKELMKNQGKRFADFYTVIKLIGHGAFAKVSTCTQNSTQEKYAVKSVNKNLEDPEKQRKGIIKEIAIMSMLEDHPNTVKLLEVYEDNDAYQLVMELCSGGELFDQIIAKDAAAKMQSLLDFIAYAHSKDIIHRDLKPENILLSDKLPTATLKVIDFGTSDFCKSGQRLQQKFGTPYYVAPEVLKKDYNKQADIWSAGVIMYILLCGFPPFGGKTDAKVLQRVQAGESPKGIGFRCVIVTFEGREWEVVTEAAKDMISQMLVLDFSKRATANSLVQHRWFQLASTAPAAGLGDPWSQASASTDFCCPATWPHTVSAIHAIAGMSRMKRLALMVLARTLTDNDVKRLRELFAAMDTNADGRIDSNDLHNALAKVGAAIEESEMQALFHASDIDGSGQIDYEEFIAAMLDSDRVSRRHEACGKSFEELDKDGDGGSSGEGACDSPAHLVDALDRGLVTPEFVAHRAEAVRQRLGWLRHYSTLATDGALAPGYRLPDAQESRIRCACA
eukprot:gene21962-29013_t